MHRVNCAFLCVSMCVVCAALPLSAKDNPPERSQILWTTQWSHDGSRFAVGGEYTLWVYDADTLERRSLLPPSHDAVTGSGARPYMAVTHVAWHPSRNVLAVSSQGKNVSGLYDVDHGGWTPLPPCQDNTGRGVAWDPKGKRVAVSSPDDGHLRIYDDSGALLHDVPRYQDAKGLTGVAWRPTGDRIVTIGARITLHDAEGTPITQWMHRPESREGNQLLLCVAWHPSGAFFVVGDYGTEADDPVLQFWSADGDLIKSVPLEGDAELRNISWNPDGSRFATASRNIAIWTADGELEFKAPAPDLLWGVAWHPENDTLLTTDIVGRITLWNERAEPVESIREPQLEPADD